MTQSAKVTMRSVRRSDVATLVEMNHAAYPDLVADDVVWSATQLEHHLVVFPEGQLVAEVDGRVAGAISTLVVPGGSALRQHTWLEITAHGTFSTHDSRGDTLYLADVYVHPDFWGRGVAGALYESLWTLCREQKLARVVAGGRLWGFHEFDDRLTAGEYVGQVLAGRIKDRVLCSQLRAGFVVRGILANYLQDARSRSYATLLEWTNDQLPAAKRATTRPPSIRPVIAAPIP